MLSKCKNNPKRMFDVICEKYGNKEDTDLTELLEDFAECKLKNKRADPLDWFVEMDVINRQLQQIDKDFAKSKKEMCAHILRTLPKGYSGIKTVIQMKDDHLDNLDNVKKAVVKHWKVNHREKAKKKKKYESDDDSSGDSSSEASSESSVDTKKKRKKSKDKLALTMMKEKVDTINEEGKIVCGHCGKVGHSIKKCWTLHGVSDHIKK